MKGFINGPGAVKGLKLYKEFVRLLRSTGALQRLHDGEP